MARCFGIIIIAMVAVAALQGRPANAQFNPDRMTICGNLAAAVTVFRTRLDVGTATTAELRQGLVQDPSPPMAAGLWSPQTLRSAIDFAAQGRSRSLAALQARALAVCEARLPDGDRLTVGLLRRFCGDLSQRAYLAALARDGGLSRSEADARTFASTRAEFRPHAADAVAMAYRRPWQSAADVGTAIMQRCMRQPDVILR